MASTCSMAVLPHCTSPTSTSLHRAGAAGAGLRSRMAAAGTDTPTLTHPPPCAPPPQRPYISRRPRARPRRSQLANHRWESRSADQWRRGRTGGTRPMGVRARCWPPGGARAGQGGSAAEAPPPSRSGRCWETGGTRERGRHRGRYRERDPKAGGWEIPKVEMGVGKGRWTLGELGREGE